MEIAHGCQRAPVEVLEPDGGDTEGRRRGLAGSCEEGLCRRHEDSGGQGDLRAVQEFHERCRDPHPRRRHHAFARGGQVAHQICEGPLRRRHQRCENDRIEVILCARRRPAFSPGGALRLGRVRRRQQPSILKIDEPIPRSAARDAMTGPEARNGKSDP